MNNDELQKAIDDITNSNATTEAAAPEAAAVSAAENEQLANEMAAPSAPVTGAGVDLAPTPEVDLGTAPAPAVPEEPAMPPVEAAAAPEAPVAAPAVETPVMGAIETPAVEAAPEAPVSDNATLEEAMKELYPLLDRVEMPIEEKFDITLKYGEPAKALELAKQMTDENAKANALLAIVEKLK